MNRIQGIVFGAGEVKTFAEIGCDHAHITQSILQNNQINTAYATDISEKCLQKAKKLLKNHQNVVFLAGNGLHPIKNHLNEIDCIAICGMGGNTICNILTGFDLDLRLVLQPQTHAELVRQHVLNQKFDIINDFITYERGKFYDIIVCKPCKTNVTATQLQLTYGMFYNQKSPLLFKRLTQQAKKLQSYKKTQKNQQLLQQIQSVLKLYN